MVCNLTQSVALGCRDSRGGAKEIYLVEHESVESITKTLGVISDITMVATKVFFQYAQEIETCNFQQIIQTNDVNGSKFYEQDLNVVINNPSASIWNEIDLLAQNKLAVIILDNNGKYWYMGEVNGARMQPSTGGTGTAFGDRNGITLAFKGKEPYFAAEVEASVIPTII